MRLLTLGAWLGACATAGAVAGLVLLAGRCLLDALHSRIARVIVGSLVAVAVAVPAGGQEGERPGSRMVAAYWCEVVSTSPGRRDHAPDPATDGEGGQQEEQVGQEPDDEDVGCDGGLGLGLIGRDFSQGRLSLVAVVGSKSVGVGAAWTIGEWQRPVSVAVGLVAPFDSGGVYLEGAALAVGATVGLGGR